MRSSAAFEHSALSADAFGERVQSLGHKAKTLRARQNEIEDELPEDDDLPVPDPEIIAELYRELEAIAASAPDLQRRATADRAPRLPSHELRKHAAQTFVAGLAIIPPKRSGTTNRPTPPKGRVFVQRQVWWPPGS
ncbi:MAG: hypothetical protein WBA31_02070 [Candidatus Dormiibacterota bacterium]